MREQNLFADLIPKRRRRVDMGEFADLAPQAKNEFADLIPEKRKNPNEQYLGKDFIAGAEEAKKGLLESPKALLRGAINTVQNFADTLPDAVLLGVGVAPTTVEYLTGHKPSEIVPRIPKPDAPETMFGKAVEIGGEVAAGFVPIERAAQLPRFAQRLTRAPGLVSRAARGVEAAAPEIASTARVASEKAIPEAVQASEAATKAAEALTPEALALRNARRALPENVDGFSVQNLSVDETAKRTQLAIMEAGDNFREARRLGTNPDTGKRISRTFAETKADAEAVGMSAEDLMRMKPGTVLNDAETTAARQIAINEAATFSAAAKVIDPTDPAQLEAFKGMAMRAATALEKSRAAISEGARALNATKIQLAPERRRLKALENILNGAHGNDPAEMVKMVQSLDDPVQVARFMRKLPEATTVDKIKEVWINGLLSGPTTHIKNFVSNSLVAAYSLPERVVASAIGAVSRSPNRVYFREVIAQAAGMGKAMKQATRTAWKTLVDEGAATASGKVELAIPAANKGVTGKIVRSPGRALEAADQWFKAINYGGEIEALATRRAIREGMKGDDIGRRVAELLSNPPDDLAKQAWKKAEVATFTNSLNEQKGLIAKGARAIQHLKVPEKIAHRVPAIARPVNAALDMSSTVIFPFVRTPTNILKFSVARSPLGILMRDVQRELAMGGARAQEAWANMILGSSMAGTVGTYAYQTGNERITGAGPSDANARKVWRMSGRQPYSIKIGDTWYSYGGLEPVGTLIGLAADFAEIGNTLTWEERDKAAAMLGMAFSRNVKEKTFLQGMSAAVEAMDDPDNKGARFIRDLAGSAIPTVAAQAARARDPVIRDAQGIMGRMRSRMPIDIGFGKSTDVAPLMNLKGEEITRENSGPSAMFNPVYISTQKNDPVTEEMIRLGVSPRMPEREIGGVRLTPKQYVRFVRLAGQPAWKELTGLVRSPQWSKYSDFDREQIIRDAIKYHRSYARDQLRIDFPELDQAITAQELERMR